MTYILNKPYFLFLALIIVFLIVGFLNPKEILDINIHDTYYVISYRDLGIILSFIYSFLAIVYFLLIQFNFPLIKWMTITHVAISIGGLFLIVGFYKLIRETKPGDFESIIKNIDFNAKITIAIFSSVFAAIIVQMLFFVNVIQALIKGKI
jgi:hypothetical protein